jgi:nitrate/nitrite transport system substrate-binding protein
VEVARYLVRHREQTLGHRSDLWLEAAKGLGLDLAGYGDSRGVETFFDGKTFDPASPDAYLASLSIKAMV